MEIINVLHHILNKNEQKSIVKFITRTKKETKTIQIYQHLKKGDSDAHIAGKLNIDMNLYRRLKSSLLKEVFKGLSVLYFDWDVINESMHMFILGRIMKEKNQPAMAEYFFKKAEKKIYGTNAYFRYILYTEWIDLYTQQFFKNPEELIQKRSKALDLLQIEAMIDSKASRLLYSIKRSQNFSTDPKLLKEMEDTIKAIRKSNLNTPTIRWKFYDSITRVLMQKKDYHSIVNITQKTFNEFQKKQWFNKETHEKKIKMLINLVNAYYLTGNTVKSLETLNLLEVTLKEYKNMLYGRYCFYLYNGMVMNYSVTDKNKAIEILLKALKDQMFMTIPENVLYAHLNLSIQYFDTKEYKKAITHLVNAMNNETFKKLDPAFQLKILVFELILRYYREDFDYCDSLILKIRRLIKKIKSKTSILNDIMIVDMVEKLIENKPFDKNKIILEIRRNRQTYKEQDLIQYDIWLEQM